MENKINIAEILKDCPKGMELDCAVFDNVYFNKVDNHLEFPIECYILCGERKLSILFTKYGEYSILSGAKCTIFPKGKTTWEGFQRPFKDGDIVFYNDTIAIFKEWGDETLFRTYVTKYLCCDSLIDTNVPLFGARVRKEIRLATEEEKAKLFDAIKSHGYKWNPETKTLEKLIEPKFKVGDKIKHKDSGIYCTLGEYSEGISAYRTDIGGLSITYKNMEQWELAPNKFDIDTLVPYESRVLVRNGDNDIWKPAIFGCYIYKSAPYYVLGGTSWKYCIPYEGNKHLLRTTNDCDDYYKIW